MFAAPPLISMSSFELAERMSDKDNPEPRMLGQMYLLYTGITEIRIWPFVLDVDADVSPKGSALLETKKMLLCIGLKQSILFLD